jgi:hypothetical protein
MTFSTAGVYRVGTQAVDRRLDLSTRSTTVVRIGGATGEPPLANAVLDKMSGPVPLTVNINMSGSTDADGTIANYYIGCGGYFASPSSSPTGNCQFTTPGVYWLVLQVMDNSGLMDVLSTYVVATPSGGGGGGGGGGSDTTPPSVTMTSPAEGATISGTVAVSADASDTSGISKVDFYRDSGVWIGTATTASGISYSINWNTTGLTAGAHTLYAIATDTANNTATSALRNITISAPPPPPPPSTGPTVSITSPTGPTVTRKSNVAIAASATPGSNPVNRVDIYVNSGLLCSDTTPANGYSCGWKVPAAPGKTYSIYAIAYDTAGLSGTSSTVTVTAP